MLIVFKNSSNICKLYNHFKLKFIYSFFQQDRIQCICYTKSQYYLIGFSKDSFLPLVFKGIAWSTESVLEQTLHALKESKPKPYMLPRWHDVDDMSGLKILVERAENTGFQNSRTMAFLLEKTPWILDEIKSSGGLSNV